MNSYINELYKFELESGRLDFEDDPGYRDVLSRFSQQYQAVWQAGDHGQCEQLYSSCFDLAHFSSRAAFCRGMCLGIGLICRGIGGLSGL